MRQLPTFDQLLWPAARTFFRGVNISPKGILLEARYDQVPVEASDLAAYRQFMGLAEEAPLSYLYLLAQRAQIATMLDQDFSIAIIGMIHLENYLYQKAPFRYDQPFDIEVRVAVDYKASGSLSPVLEVVFWQKKILVAHCESRYLAKRKSKQPKNISKNTSTLEPATNWAWSETWTLAADTGRQYARVSGDRNPIHTSTLFARLVGFARPIAHGWYAVARAVGQIQQQSGRSIAGIEVQFKSPVLLPSQVTLQVSAPSAGQFALVRHADAPPLLAGQIIWAEQPQ
jgi:acyl dehydratase